MSETVLRTARGELRFSGTAVMGIVNATPDSFSDGGLHADAAAAVAAGVAMHRAGALLVDVGGESTRPGAEPVDADTETARVLPVVEGLVAAGVPVSIDTLKPEVAGAAIKAGASMVNDVGGLRNERMLEVCAEHGAAVVIVHMKGTPGTMQDDPSYGNVVAEVGEMLVERARAAEAAGSGSVLIDPGIGFGKTLEHNLELLAGLPTLAGRGWPVLVGASRKSFLGRLTGVTAPEDRDAASVAAHLHAARAGAAMVRAHDVAGHVQALRTQEALEQRRWRGRFASDRIVIKGMEFFARHGVLPEEQRLGQRFKVDVELWVESGSGDNLGRTADYSVVYEVVREAVTGTRFNLIEALAAEIAERVLAGERRALGVTVRVHKPAAPLPGVFADVFAEVRRERAG